MPRVGSWLADLTIESVLKCLKSEISKVGISEARVGHILKFFAPVIAETNTVQLLSKEEWLGAENLVLVYLRLPSV